MGQLGWQFRRWFWKKERENLTILMCRHDVPAWDGALFCHHLLLFILVSPLCYRCSVPTAPSAGPHLEVRHISGSTVELSWIPVPVELLHGFLCNYTLVYKSRNQSARSELHRPACTLNTSANMCKEIHLSLHKRAVGFCRWFFALVDFLHFSRFHGSHLTILHLIRRTGSSSCSPLHSGKSISW